MDASSVKWLLDRMLLARALPTGRPGLADALAAQGNETFLMDYSPMELPGNLPTWEGECVVAYGSVQMVRKVMKARAGSWQPGSFFRPERLSYSAWSPFLGDLMLNDDFVILPYGEFKRRGLASWGGAAFIRPDAVTKSFTGFVISENDFEHEVNSLECISHVQPEEMVVIARPKEILGEFRFVIADGKVVTGSAYSWDRKFDVRSDVDPACWEIAEEIAERPWQADRAYICDVALTHRGPRLLELNALSCSGLYACDTTLVAKAVSEAALREWAGEDY